MDLFVKKDSKRNAASFLNIATSIFEGFIINDFLM